jgi:alpha-glucosidase
VGHDKHRIASKLGQPQARVLAMLLLTLRDTPFFVAGDELGMERARIPQDATHDPFEKLVPGYGLNRDPERVPMPWDATSNGGFTTGEPWLPIGQIGRRNVADLQKAGDRSCICTGNSFDFDARRQRFIQASKAVAQSQRSCL